MKYKKIKGALHDLGQSFMGSSNFGLGGFVNDVVCKLAKEPPYKLAINFSTCEISPAQKLKVPLPAAVREYHEALPGRLAKHGVDPEAVDNVMLVHIHDGTGHRTEMLAWDDRGKQHSIEVKTL